jgi:hypothetical protein
MRLRYVGGTATVLLSVLAACVSENESVSPATEEESEDRAHVVALDSVTLDTRATTGASNTG